MLSSRVSLSRDVYAAGKAVVGTPVLFVPLNRPDAPTTAPPTPAATTQVPNPTAAPADTRPVVIADRVFVSNKGANDIFVRPIIPGSTEAPEYPYSDVNGARGGTAYNAQWIGISVDGITVAPLVTTGIIVPAGAIAFPIECVCVGLAVGGTAADTLTYAAYGSNARA